MFQLGPFKKNPKLRDRCLGVFSLGVGGCELARLVENDVQYTGHRERVHVREINSEKMEPR